MVGSFVRLAAAAALCTALAACTTTPSSYYGEAGPAARPTAPRAPNSVLQCVPYAREHSHIAIYGDAYTWWDQAAGHYARSTAPSEGSVLVLYNYAGPQRGHLAVVRKVIDEREIRVDHANWLDDGEIFVNDPVRDVSPGNDWSMVRVFNIRTGAWGSNLYPVQGFIGPGPDDNPVLVARNPSASVRVAQRPVVQSDSPAEPHDYVADLLENDPAFDGGGAPASSEDQDDQ